MSETFSSNYDYRQFLIKNANKIMKYNLLSTCDKTDTIIPVDNYKTIENNYQNPYLYRTLRDNYKPKFYEDSDLKQLYISREELNNRLHTPIITQDELLRKHFLRAN